MNTPADQIEWLLQPIAEMIANPETQDIAIQRPYEVWRRTIGWSRHEVPEFDHGRLEAIAFMTAHMREQNLGPVAPLCLTETPSGGRAMLCVPPAVEKGVVAISWREHG